MDKFVERAINAALAQSEKVSGYATGGFRERILGAFSSGEDFMSKVAEMDAAFDDEPRMESLREIFFDLLMVNFFSEDVKKLEEDYLDSEEWEEIEDATIDRGTELLNVLLYLRECRDENIKPELEDFLKEFLLVEDDEFQDEHRIYEDIIANQALMESSIPEISRVAGKLKEDAEMKELFYPVMCFFLENDPSGDQTDEYIRHSADPQFDASVYAMLTAFK